VLLLAPTVVLLVDSRSAVSTAEFRAIYLFIKVMQSKLVACMQTRRSEVPVTSSRPFEILASREIAAFCEILGPARAIEEMVTIFVEQLAARRWHQKLLARSRLQR